ncbi:MAG: gliding motility lipoprotein GldB [Flavobacteriaceae bacterium]
MVLTLLGLIHYGCKNISSEEVEIRQLEMPTQWSRFELEFHKSEADQIPALKQNFPYLFPAKFNDSIWYTRQKDSLQLLLVEAVEEKFPSLDFLEADLKHLFQHVKYEFPDLQPPHLITLVNNVDYQSKTVYADSLLLISIDTYMGNDHPLYEGIPQYIRQEMDLTYLKGHVLDKFLRQRIGENQRRELLEVMIYEGKLQYLKSRLWPHDSAYSLMGYTAEQQAWAEANERYIWQYFIERELLYETHPSYLDRFIHPAPFSKFYLELDGESPGKIGVWLGWQMVQAYMEKNPETSLASLVRIPAQILFQKSQYKPKK